MEDFTKSERVMNMFEFKKAIIEDEITEVFMKLFDHVAVHDERQSRVIDENFITSKYNIYCGLSESLAPADKVNKVLSLAQDR